MLFFRKHFVLRLTLIFVSANITKTIKYALSDFIKKFIQKRCSSDASSSSNITLEDQQLDFALKSHFCLH